MTVEFFGEVDPAESKQLVNVPPSHLPSRLPALLVNLLPLPPSCLLPTRKASNPPFCKGGVGSSVSYHDSHFCGELPA